MSRKIFSLTAPQFWWLSRPTFFASLLSPLGTLYGFMTHQRMARTGAQLGIPIICVGNFTVGGAGKTPVALALGALLQAQGLAIAFVSRGFGAKAILRQPLRVDANRHDAFDVGDEALLLAKLAPTYVCKNRVLAAQAAKDDGARCIILDDGLQNPSLTKTLTLAVVPAQNPPSNASGNVFGNGLCFPAGPLRARVQDQLSHVDGLVVLSQVGEDASASLDARLTTATLPIFTASIVMDALTIQRLKGARVFAFAGIGKPEKFYASLKAQGIKVEQTQNFPDHYCYTNQDYAALVGAAQKVGLQLVTTQKDYVKIKSFDRTNAIIPVPITASFAEADKLLALLHTRVTAST